MKTHWIAGLLLLGHYGSVGQIDSALQVITDVVTIRSSALTLPLSRSEIKLDSTLSSETLADLLNTTPGLWMQSGALNTNRISIRGVGNREPFATSKLKAYLDEIPLTNGIGESNLEDISPALLEAIDIWRSPASAIWGAGLGGMLHLKTTRPERNAVNLALTGGSFGRIATDASGMLISGREDAHATLLSHSYLGDDGFRENNRYRRHSTTLLHKWRMSPRWQTSFFFHRIDLRAFIPSSLGWTAFHETPHAAAGNWAAVSGNEDYTRWLGAIGWQWSDNTRWTFKGSLFTTQFDLDETRPFNVLQETDATWGVRARLLYQASNTVAVTIGTELHFEDYQATTFETVDPGVRGVFLGQEEEQRNYLNLFADMQWQVSPRLLVYSGLNINSTRLRGSGELEYPTDLSPMLSVSYSLSPQALVAFASVSRGFSPVSIGSARNADGTINRDLKPESGWNIESGLRLKTHAAALEIVAYRMLIDNLVVQKRLGPDLYEASNAGETLHQGVELTGSAQLNWLTLSGSYTLSDHRFKTFIDGDDNFSGNDLTGSAPQIVQLAIATSGLTPQPKLEYRFAARTPITDDNLTFGPASHVVDLSCRVPFAIGAWHSAAVLRLDNLFDTRYASMYQINARGFGGSEPRYYYPGKPRSVYLTLQFNLGQ